VFGLGSGDWYLEEDGDGVGVQLAGLDVEDDGENVRRDLGETEAEYGEADAVAGEATGDNEGDLGDAGDEVGENTDANVCELVLWMAEAGKTKELEDDTVSLSAVGGVRGGVWGGMATELSAAGVESELEEWDMAEIATRKAR